MRAITTEEFIERSVIVHKGKYSYDKTDLSNKDEKGKIIVTCPIHGDFKQYPYNHLRGVGCPKCATNIKKTTADVIKEIKMVHGDKYIIPEDFEYINNKTKLHIICPIHGDFYPYYANFILKRHGCKKCSCHIFTTEEFVNEITKIYGDMFSYEKVVFQGYRKKVVVKCKKCGKEIEVYPQRLLDGHFQCDCTCKPYTILEEEVAKQLDKLNIEYIYQYKNDWLKYKENLSIDFFLPKYNIGIECQGRFHFEPYKRGDDKSINNFEKQYSRDKVKYNLCKNKGIKMLYYTNIEHDKYFAKTYDDIKELIRVIIN